jgi:hypothetical protein
LNKRTISVIANYAGLLASIVWLGMSAIDIVRGTINGTDMPKGSFHELSLAAIFLRFSLNDIKRRATKVTANVAWCFAWATVAWLCRGLAVYTVERDFIGAVVVAAFLAVMMAIMAA